MMGISVNPSCPLGGGGVLRVAEGVLGGRLSSETGSSRAMLGSEASARGASGSWGTNPAPLSGGGLGEPFL